MGENSKADLKYIIYGLTQKSVLGPLLFLAYVNSLPMHLTF